MKHAQRKTFKLTPVAAAIAVVLSTQFLPNTAQAGAGFGSGVTIANTPNAVPTYYANSPAGPVPVLVGGVPTIRTDGSGLPVDGTTGAPMRKFVDPLQLFGVAKINAAGQYIPVAVPEKWVDTNGVASTDDYYELAAVEYTQQLHSDLPKATHLRGYVQLETPGNAATSKHIQLFYPIPAGAAAGTAAVPIAKVQYAPGASIDATGKIVTLSSVPATAPVAGYAVSGGGFPAGTTVVSFTAATATTPATLTTSAASTTPGALEVGLTITGGAVYAYDTPHHLGPVINATKGTAVRVKFTNYLPIYQGTTGGLFLPVDSTIGGAGLGPDGVTAYTQNRAGIHVLGAQAPWVSAGTPHQWVAPAGETAAYAAGIGKGASTQNVPDMADPGPGSVTLYYPNQESARLTFFRDETSGIARLNTYAGMAGGYKVVDPVEQILINGGTIAAGTGAVTTATSVAAGTIPADEIPLIFEDKTFVPTNVAQQDALWSDPNWGKPGDLWFPHVYEPNQDPTQSNGTNPVGRWDYGPMFWPIFQVSPDKATLPSPSFVPEAYMDTVLVNGTAYPTVTVDPKAYRVRMANASTDRYLNLGFYVADGSVTAPVLDANGNPTVDQTGAAIVRANTEVKMIPAAAIDAAGDPPGWDVANGVQTPLPQTSFPWHINYAMSGPTRAWPVDARVGGVPDPATSGPDFIQIGSDGGFLPGAVDIPSQPITYEQNRRSITVTNIYGYGMLLGPGERADTIVDFSAFAGKTLLLFNDAPAPTPFVDGRDDYFTGDPDQTALGGAYTTMPGYGPNTRTVLQVVVNATNTSGTGGPINTAGLATALPAAYAATQPGPLVNESVYNAAFGTSNADTFARVASGSAAQPNLTFSGTGTLSLTGIQLVTSGGAGTGAGSGYLTPPTVVLTSTNGLGSGASAHAYIGTTTTGSIDTTGTVVTVANVGILGVGSPVSGGGFPAGTTIAAINAATNTFTTSLPSTTPSTANAALTFGACQPNQICGVVLDSPGTGYTAAPTVTFLSDNAVAGVTVSVPGTGYTAADQVVFTGGGGQGAAAKLSVTSSSSLATTSGTLTGGAGYTVPPTVSFVAPGTVVTAGVVPPSTVPAGGQAAVATATISSSALVLGATSTPVPGAGYTAPVAVVSAPQLAGTTATATPVVGYAVAPVTIAAGTGIAPTNGSAAWNLGTNPAAPTPSATVSFSAPTYGTSLPVATVTVDTAVSSPTYGLITGIVFSSYGAGYTSPPTVTISDLGGNTATLATSATAVPSTAAAPAQTVALAANSGQIFGVNVATAGSGYTAPASITFTDATGSGASAIAAVVGPSGPSLLPVGAVTGLSFTSAGAGYTTAPTVVFTEPSTLPAPTTAASATFALSTAVGAITAVTITNQGSGYTSAPTVSITSAAGTGANLVAGVNASGVGAQATVLTSNSKSIPVLTKAEQELFDDYGRYNSTGGVELPYTTATTQTTIPLNYSDAPTEVLGDGEVQIWKIVDNGFWTNSIHFNSANVQLVNRVGWDGTVKPPAQNEVGWKDTMRLNPLEDMIVAVQGVRSQASFGQPRSARLQDPTTPAGTPSHPAAPAPGVAGTRYVPGLGFTVDPGVVQQANLFAAGTDAAGAKKLAPALGAIVPVGTQLLTAAANTSLLPASPTGNYDNEFLWGTAIMGHGTDDLQRPVVFNPVVQVPNAPSALADTLGTGALSWVDPTPAATSAGNVQNEVGFQVLQAPVSNGAPSGAFVPFANVPANTVNFKEPSPLVSPTPPNGQFYAYEVVAYNAAGVSPASNVVIEAPPAAPTAGSPFITAINAPVPGISTTDVQTTVNWLDNAINETSYVVTRKGGSGATPVLSAGKVTAVTGGTTAVATIPANPNGPPTNTDIVDASTGVTASTGAATLAGWTAPVEGAWYEYDIVAQNAFGPSTPVLVGTVQAPISVPLAPTNLVATPTIAPCATPVDAVTKLPVPVQCKPDNIVLTWTNNAFNDTSYRITRTGGPNGTLFTPVVLAANATTWTDTMAQEGYTYNYAVNAVNLSIAGTPQAGVATVQAVDVPTAPTVPSNVVVTPSTAIVAPTAYNAGVPVTYGTYADQATITWSDNAYNELTYQVFRDGLPVSPQIAGSAMNNPFGNATPGWTASPVMSFTDVGMGDGTTHTWTVAATNGVGTTTSAATTKTMPGIIIAPPSNVVATPNRAGSSIGLSWTDNSNNESDFLVEESVSTTGGAPGSFSNWSVAGVVARSAAQTTATGGTVNFNRANVPTTPGYVYTFRISARNQANSSDSHPYAYAQASLLAPAIPAAPTLTGPVVTQRFGGGVRVRLTWNKIAPAAGTTISYIVLANGVQIAAVPQPFLATATTVTYAYIPAAVTGNISYTVETVATAIRSANPTAYGSSTSAQSNAVVLGAAPAAASAPTAITPAVNAATGAVTLSWTAPAAVTGVTYTYQVSVNGGAAQALASGGTLNVARGAIYQVQVRTVATDAQGVATTGAYSAAVAVNTLPAQSTALTNALAATRSFNVSFNNTSTNITGFTIQRGVSTTAGGAVTWTTIAVTPTKAGNVYTFNNTVTAAGFYRFRVLATSAVGSTTYVTSPTVQTP